MLKYIVVSINANGVAVQIVIMGGLIVLYKRLQNSVFINADRHECLINLDLM
jgi:hypothetical protein